MRIWLTHLGELLPIDGPVRLYRYGVLADILAAAGHPVVRWAPTFVHLTKTYRSREDGEVDLSENYQLQLLHARGYRKHVGWARHRFHREMARKFLHRAEQLAMPDLILTAMPTPELCEAACQFGKRHDIPVVVDIRDLWPDVLLRRLPAWSSGISNRVFRRAVTRNRQICRDASAIVGISEGFLEWGLQLAQREATPLDRVFPMGRHVPECHGPARRAAETFWDSMGVAADGRFRCCFFGTMASLFDLETIIAGAARLQEAGMDGMQFVICGDGPMSARYRRLSHGLSNVIWPGWVSTDQITVLLERSCVGLAPYKEHVQSTLPNKAVDYLSAGLPILSSRGGELATTINELDCGVSYSSGDEVSFCNAVTEMQRQPDHLQSMGENGRSHFDAHLEAGRVYGEMAEYFQEIVGQRTERERKCA